jgi:hypothetical protein
MENRIAELKHDLGADGFCLQEFFATEAAFRAVLLLFNLLGEFQRAAGLPGYRAPATIRTQVLTCGAILGRAGRRLVIHLSQSWGGLKSSIPLLDSLFACEFPTSPKLPSALEPDPRNPAAQHGQGGSYRLISEFRFISLRVRSPFTR